MSASEGTDDDQSTRPISVAELLARNGTIGAPPVSGRRRRRRGNSSAVTVAELTGEIPVIRDEPPVAAVDAEGDAGVDPDVQAEADVVAEPEPDTAADAQADADAPEPARFPPLLSGDPHPQRGGGLQRGHDPRPLRRSSGAEQMAYDPVDDSVDLAELVGDQEADEEALRSYLKSSSGTLFSGETVADDLARRGIGDMDGSDADSSIDAAAVAPEPAKRPAGSRTAAVRLGAVAVLQSVLAVVFGAGLFLGFDQLWRWNTIVALVLSVLVILSLVIAVRVVRKTEDIASTLIAVAVGALVTLGPLALLQSYG